MQDTLLRDKNEITLPGEVVEAAGLRPGRDRIAFRWEGGEIRGRPVAQTLTREQVTRAIQGSPLRFTRTWEEMRQETREP